MGSTPTGRTILKANRTNCPIFILLQKKENITPNQNLETLGSKFLFEDKGFKNICKTTRLTNNNIV